MNMLKRTLFIKILNYCDNRPYIEYEEAIFTQTYNWRENMPIEIDKYGSIVPNLEITFS
jgi:hypothetical protein